MTTQTHTLPLPNAAGAPRTARAPRPLRKATAEPVWLRATLIATALAFLGCFLFVPLLLVFAEAFKKGVDVYLAAISDPDALDAIQLTLTAAAIAVPLL